MTEGPYLRKPLGSDEKTLRTAQQLVDYGFIDKQNLQVIEAVANSFSVAISPQVSRLIDAADAKDPIAAQFIPSAPELTWSHAELADPIGDRAHSPVTGIIHRYPDRVLLLALSTCAVYCRFCFRRETVANGSPLLDDAQLEQALAYIESNSKIWEVILSGGDPLLLSSRRLHRIMQRLERIAHVGVVRFHTRIPVVRAELIDAELLAALKIRKAVYVVLHTNHARELTSEAREACAKLIDAGFPMLSQTVLLQGVNADAATLTTLFRALVEMRIKPYYLHHGDLARGTRHFRTTIANGQQIMRDLRSTVSGLCQPTYVLDIPGGYGKVPVGPQYARAAESDQIDVCDVHGHWHAYRDHSTTDNP